MTQLCLKILKGTFLDTLCTFIFFKYRLEQCRQPSKSSEIFKNGQKVFLFGCTTDKQFFHFSLNYDLKFGKNLLLCCNGYISAVVTILFYESQKNI